MSLQWSAMLSRNLSRCVPPSCCFHNFPLSGGACVSDECTSLHLESSLTVCRIQEERWQELVKQLPQSQMLWRLPASGHNSIGTGQPQTLTAVDLLSRIEDHQFMHALTIPKHQHSVLHQPRSISRTYARSAARNKRQYEDAGKNARPAKKKKKSRALQEPTDANKTYAGAMQAQFAVSVLQYYLPRFNLHFELRPDCSRLHSYDYAGYYVAGESTLQQALSILGPRMQRLAPLPLPLLFRHFIVLVADSATSPVKVIIPDVVASQGSTRLRSFVCPNSQARIEHHVYDFHPYIGNLGTSGVHSRLHLAALHAACSCAAPLPGLGMTGGEYALQLLGQCWVNRPLTAAESRTLSALTAAAGHTPALQLLCARTHAATTALAFLYERPAMRAPLSHEEWLKSHLPHKGQAMCAYSQELQRSGRFHVVCSRRLLSEDDSQALLTGHVRSRRRDAKQACVVVAVEPATVRPELKM